MFTLMLDGCVIYHVSINKQIYRP